MEGRVEELSLLTYVGVDKYKSIRRAIKRGHVVPTGFIVPKRPFNNRKRTSGREMQLTKEKIYEQLTNRN